MNTVGRRLIVVFKALVSFALVAYLLSDVSVSETWHSAKRLPASAALAALVLLLGYAAVGALRWLLVLRSMGSAMPTLEALRITYISVFFNQILPATVGADAIRIWEASRGGLRLAPAINSVLIERIVHLLSLSMLAAATVSAWSNGRIPKAMTGTLWLVFGVALLAVLCLSALDRVPLWRSSTRLRVSVKRLNQDLQTLLRSPAPMVGILGTVLLGQALLSGAIFVLAVGLGIRIGIADCMALLPAVLLLSALPISIAGWGVREYAMVTTLAYAGTPAASALLLSLLLGMFAMIAAVPGGVVWFLVKVRRHN